VLLASPSHEGSRCGGCFWNRSAPPRSIAVEKAVLRLPERLFSAFEEADRYDCESKGRLHGLFCVLVLKILLSFYSVTTSDHGLPQWKEVLEWIVFSPKDLSLQDKNGQTILHHLCLFRAPVEIIQMALWQAPELASTANADGEIPLHWATRLSAPTECIRSLLQSDRASGTNFQDKDGHTPLSLLWDRHNSRFLEVWWENNEKLHSLPAWKRILMFFEEEGETTAPSPLHVAARTACPPALFPLMIQVYRDQLLIVDDDGRNPLQLACSDPVSNRSTDVKSKIEFLLYEGKSIITQKSLHSQSGISVCWLTSTLSQHAIFRSPSERMFRRAWLNGKSILQMTKAIWMKRNTTRLTMGVTISSMVSMGLSCGY
jgi:hypothetical protein